jgi:hypothetical protein
MSTAPFPVYSTALAALIALPVATFTSSVSLASHAACNLLAFAALSSSFYDYRAILCIISSLTGADFFSFALPSP